MKTTFENNQTPQVKKPDGFFSGVNALIISGLIAICISLLSFIFHKPIGNFFKEFLDRIVMYGVD